ncbi:MAG: DUF2330 domain-containing protein [Deltaproteobacteria bacterium]|nr:MAG: DUF2330 domain-containing protein [Deltaproteobacteria bacterium]
MRSLALATALVLMPTAEALACGGFFCNREFPIDQAGEEVVFGVDDKLGTVTTHVSIAYQGASEDFAWIVPVSEQPSLFASSDALFSALRSRTEPRFSLQYDYAGECNWDILYDDESALDPQADNDGVTGGVSVVAEEQVGPYDTVILQATSSAELLTWLNGAGYDLPNTLDSVLAPYVADGQYFVALKLSAGQDTGDLVPLGMTYRASAASVPIQLTSVAATPDMPLTVYVLGEHRAVPDNYLHVRINEAAIDWFSGGSNYRDVISQAADEAGGHGFATDFSGPTSQLVGAVLPTGYSRANLDGAADPFEWIETLMGLGLPPSAALLGVLEEAIPFPQALADQGLTPQNFYDCLRCYTEYVDTTTWDATAATDILEQDLIQGMRDAQALLDAYPRLTRMTSSLDAQEMTVDPMFVFNPDIGQDVPNQRYATLRWDCTNGEDWSRATRTLILSDGREIQLPSLEDTWASGGTEFDAMEDGGLTDPAAIVIEDLGVSGDGDMMFDYRDQAAEDAANFGQEGVGCGCNTAPGLGGGLLLGLLPLVLRRRD